VLVVFYKHLITQALGSTEGKQLSCISNNIDHMQRLVWTSYSSTTDPVLE